MISIDGIEVNSSKVYTTLSWETPKSITEIISFLGSASYSRRFLEGFLGLDLPLTQKGQAYVSYAQRKESF